MWVVVVVERARKEGEIERGFTMRFCWGWWIYVCVHRWQEGVLKAIREFALWGGVVGCFLFAGLEFGDLLGGGVLHSGLFGVLALLVL